jgi:hypothetical protein
MPRTAVPIRSSAAIEGIVPDVLVLFAWNFASDIMDKLNGRFSPPPQVVIPLPDLRIETLC